MKRKQENLEKMVEKNRGKWEVFARKISFIFREEIRELQNYKSKITIFSEKQNIFLDFKLPWMLEQYLYLPIAGDKDIYLVVGDLIPYHKIDKKKLIKKIREELEREYYW